MVVYDTKLLAVVWEHGQISNIGCSDLTSFLSYRKKEWVMRLEIGSPHFYSKLSKKKLLLFPHSFIADWTILSIYLAITYLTNHNELHSNTKISILNYLFNPYKE